MPPLPPAALHTTPLLSVGARDSLAHAAAAAAAGAEPARLPAGLARHCCALAGGPRAPATGSRRLGRGAGLPGDFRVGRGPGRARGADGRAASSARIPAAAMAAAPGQPDMAGFAGEAWPPLNRRSSAAAALDLSGAGAEARARPGVHGAGCAHVLVACSRCC